MLSQTLIYYIWCSKHAPNFRETDKYWRGIILSDEHTLIDKKSSFWLWRQSVKPSLMIPLRCLWAKSSNRRRGQFECDVTWFCFCINFVRSHVWCGCCSIVFSRFQVVQIKQVDCKMSTKNVNNCKWKTFRDIFGQIYKATKKQIRLQQMRLQLNEKKSKESQKWLMGWC